MRGIDTKRGFTIVELAVVVVVVGILAAITVVGYGAWRNNIAVNTIKNDLTQATAALEDARTWQDDVAGYPDEIPATFTASDGITLSYEQRPYGYCVSATSTSTDSVFFVKSHDPETIKEGDCSYTLATNWVGSGSYGYADGTGSSVQFVNSGAYAIGPTTVDREGNVFLANSPDNRIRKITPEGVVTTFAGNGMNNTLDGTGTAARINTPTEIITDATNNLLVSAGGLRKITPQAVVTTPIASNYGLIAGVDASNNYWFTSGGCVRKVSSSGVVLITAGTCGSYGYQDGPAGTALFGSSMRGYMDSDGEVYVADRNNHRIRKVAADGTVSTYFGTGATSGAGQLPVDGTQAAATLNEPRDVVVDSLGHVWLSSILNGHYLRKISPDGTTITTVGGIRDGVAMTRFTIPEPGYLSLDESNGVMYISGTSPYIWKLDI